MGYLINENVKWFCRLVSFVQEEMDLSLSDDYNGVVSAELIERFKKRLCVQDVNWIESTPSTEWTTIIKAKSKNGNYIHQKIQGGWEFGIDYPEIMSVEVGTDGKIYLDYPTSEDIFNYVLG